MKDPYVYPGSTILLNKFNEIDEELFKRIEADYTSLRMRQIKKHPIQGCFDIKYYLSLYNNIFQDIFKWSGKLCTINLHYNN